MNQGGPIAIVNGCENFVAKFLVAELIKKDIEVIEIGEGEASNRRVRRIDNVEDLVEEVNYVFDFEEDQKVWQKAVNDEARLAIVRVNKNDGEKFKKMLLSYHFDWRVLDLNGVYGEGMERGSKVANIFEKAVRNQVLELPAVNLEIRLMNVADAVEAIFRGTLMSGTSEENWEVWGDKYMSGKVAEIMYRGAKMTKKGVSESEEWRANLSDEEIEKTWDKLRWKPEIELGEGVKSTLQYFFGLIDEEARKTKIDSKSKILDSRNKEREAKRMWQVEVEEGEEEMVDVRSQEEEEDRSQMTDREENETLSATPNSPSKGETEIEFEDKDEEEIEEVEEEDEVGERMLPQSETGGEFRIKNSKLEEESKPIVLPYEANEIKPKILKEIPLSDNSRSRLKFKNKPKIRLKINVEWEKIAISMGVVLVLMSIVPIFTIWRTLDVVKDIEKMPAMLEEKKYDELSNKIDSDLLKIKKIEGTIDDLALKRIALVRNYYGGAKVIEEVLGLASRGVELAKMGEEFNEGVFGEKEIDWNKEVTIINDKLLEFEEKAGLLQARLDGDWSWVPARWHNLPNKGKSQLSEVREMVSLTRKTLDFLPEMIGADGKRKEYLVLLQNEMELRPGGGFIGSYAILSFEGGKLLNFDVKDVYEADGQLKGHVEPPEEIKEYLGEASWYMRDANWKAAFGSSSKDIQWFFEKETGRKVDGVIGVDLAVAKEILKVTGEIYIPDFDEKIGADNLYEQAEFYSETKFFPGSNQKESFLGLVGSQLFGAIKETSPTKRLELAGAAIDLLERNEIQIALNESKMAAKVAELGWDGGLYEGRCAGENCYTDYVYVVEANVGVNKANFFLYRNTDLTVDLSNNAVTRVLKINYENTAKNTNWPGGDYKNYMRIYIPVEANLAEVSIYNPDDMTTKRVYRSDEIKINQAGNKKEIGFLVNVPVTAKRAVEVRYTSQIDLASKDKFSYLCYVQRQPGYGNSGLVSLVSFPEEWKPLQVEPAANLVGGKLLFNHKFDRDMKMGVEISR